MTRENGDTDRVTQTSADLLAGRVQQLSETFPEAFTEGRVNFDKLRAVLGDEIDDRPERYNFTWAGKRDAQRILQMPTRATLVPCPEESVDWDATHNLFIEGDNLEVLKLMLRPYYGRVKMIYIDPPYNTGNDFIYPDNYRDPLDTYLQLTGQVDAEGNVLTSNPETSGRYHSAWLSMMYPRLFLARQLLREDGVIFVSIDDHEVHNLRLLMNEVFGEENFVACVVWQKRVSPSNDAKWFSSDHDYVAIYAKSKETWRPQRLPRNEKQRSYYTNPDNDPRGTWNSVTYTCNKSRDERPNLFYPIANPNTGREVWPRKTAVWKYSQELHKEHVEENLIYWGVDGKAKMPRFKKFLSQANDVVPRSIWPYSEVGHTQEATQEFLQLFPDASFDSPKPSSLIQRMLQIGSGALSDGIVLDFFAGSCTTSEAVLKMNHEDGHTRQFIMVQLPEPTDNPEFTTIADIGKERIRRVIAKMKAEREGQLPLETRDTPEDLGFKVFKLAPSNFRAWTGVEEAGPEAYAEQMELFNDPLVEGWAPERVIAEVALKEAGFGLNYRVEPLDEVAGQTMYRVTDPEKDQWFAICLDETLHLDALRPLGLTRDDLFVCRARALDDETAANLALQCRLKTI